MPQHFLLSAKARTLSLSTVLRMTDAEAETAFRSVRWKDGKPVCPQCECATVHECHRPNGASRFRCKASRKDFRYYVSPATTRYKRIPPERAAPGMRAPLLHDLLAPSCHLY